MRCKVGVVVCFAVALLSLSALWGGLYLTSSCNQRIIFSGTSGAVFSDYLVPREVVVPIREMYCPAPNVWTRGNMYPMPALEIMRPFDADRNGAIKFMVCSALFFCSMLFLFFLTKVRLSIWISGLMLVALCFSWIFMRTIERGNCIFVSAGLCVLFFLWFDSRRLSLRILAAIALGVATAMKISPVFLGLLYFSEPPRNRQGIRNYDLLSMVISAVVTVFLLFGPLCFGGDFVGDFSAWLANINREASAHMSTWGLHGIVRYGSGVVSRFAPWVDVVFCKWITVAAGIVLLVAYLGMVMVRGVTTKSDRIFFVVAVMLVLCTNSMFYLGIMFFPSLVLWLKEIDESGAPSPLEFCQVILWLLMLMPLQVVFEGKTATVFITFFSFWFLVVIKLALCLNRLKQRCRK